MSGTPKLSAEMFAEEQGAGDGGAVVAGRGHVRYEVPMRTPKSVGPLRTHVGG
jgi:hypothetical protein